MSTSLTNRPMPALLRRLPRPIAATVTALALVFGGAALAAPTAQAATTHTLTVNVSAPGIVVPIGIGVSVFSVDAAGDLTQMPAHEDDWAAPGAAITLPGLATGTYALQFYSETGPDDFPMQFLGNTIDKFHAQRVTVDADRSVDFAAVAGTTVSGSVKTTTGAAVETTVALMIPGGSNGSRYWQTYKEVDVAPDGTFSFGIVLPGTYSVRSEDQDAELSTWYGGLSGTVESITGPQTFTVAATPTTGIDIVTAKAGTLAGILKTAAGLPIDYGRAYLYERTTDAFGHLSYDLDQGDEAYVENGEYDFARITPGTYTLEVEISGTGQRQFLGGTNSALQATTFTIVPGQQKVLDYTMRAFTITAPSTTTLALPRTKSAFGTSAGTATVTVTGTQAVSGSVQLLDGAKVLGTKALASGKATFALSATTAVGAHGFKARYVSSGVLGDSTSAVRTLVVAKAAAKVTAKLAKTSIKASSKGSLTVKVSATGTVPAGKVVVKDGSKVLVTAILVKGAKTITLPKLKKGKHKLAVTYAGSTTVGAASAGTTLTVT